MSNELNVSKQFADLQLGPGQSGEFFIEHGKVTGNKLAFYRVVPTRPRDADQLVEIFEIFTLRKGLDHGVDAGALQTRLRVKNLSLAEAVVFDLYQAETDNDDAGPVA